MKYSERQERDGGWGREGVGVELLKMKMGYVLFKG